MTIQGPLVFIQIGQAKVSDPHILSNVDQDVSSFDIPVGNPNLV
jgi:hypothetical protein